VTDITAAVRSLAVVIAKGDSKMTASSTGNRIGNFQKANGNVWNPQKRGSEGISRGLLSAVELIGNYP
jgi:hypothetical protein